MITVKMPYQELGSWDYSKGDYRKVTKTPTNEAVPEATLLKDLRFKKDKWADPRPLPVALLVKLEAANIKSVKDLRNVSKKSLTETHKASKEMADRLIYAAKLAAVFVPGGGWPAEVSVPVNSEIVRLARIACQDDEAKAQALVVQIAANHIQSLAPDMILRAAANARLATAKRLREEADKQEAEAKEFTSKTKKAFA